MNDTRNLVNQYKGKSIEEIVDDLDKNTIELEIAIDNVERDFNMGTIVRSANAFGVRHIHIIGRRQWNKRGAMMTDKYLHVHYYTSIDDFLISVSGKVIIAIDNTDDAETLYDAQLPRKAVMIFGAEGPGIRTDLLRAADRIVAIEQFGSTRSLNVGVAAGIAMYAWLTQNALGNA